MEHVGKHKLKVDSRGDALIDVWSSTDSIIRIAVSIRVEGAKVKGEKSKY